VQALNPRAPALAGAEAERPEALTAPRFLPAKLDEESFARWLGANEPAPHTTGHTPSRHGETIEAFSFMTDIAISEAQLTVFREAMRVLHGPKLLRVKGLVRITETPDQPVMIHHVQSVAHPPVRLPRWPSRDRRTRMVFITDGVARETIEGFWTALVKAG